MNSYFMKKTALKSILYGNYVHFMEICCHFYGNLLYFMEICCTLWKFCVTFMEIYCNLWKFCVTGVNEEGRPLVSRDVIFTPFGVGRGRSGSVGVGRGTGTFSGPIRAPEPERSELWKLCSTFMENFHGQSCTGSIMEISCTLWKKSVNNR